MPRCGVNKISDCQFMCQKNFACQAFQYVPPPGLTGQCTTGECYLATRYNPIDNPQTFAGPKYCGKCSCLSVSINVKIIMYVVIFEKTFMDV